MRGIATMSRPPAHRRNGVEWRPIVGVVRLGSLTAGAIVSLVSGACVSDDDAAGQAGEAGGGAVVWEEYCDARASLGCAGFDTAACNAQGECAAGLIRDEIERALLTCLLRGCDSQLESCYDEQADVPLSAAGEAFRDACQARVAGCCGDDYCQLGFLLSDGALADVAAVCLDVGSCEDACACLPAYADANVLPCLAAI